jgi:PTS system nitrogen regulatory IIA component
LLFDKKYALFVKGELKMENKEVLTTEEAARFLSLTPYTLREYARKGLIPARKMGKSWRFYKPDIIAWLRGKEQENQ